MRRSLNKSLVRLVLSNTLSSRKSLVVEELPKVVWWALINHSRQDGGCKISLDLVDRVDSSSLVSKLPDLDNPSKLVCLAKQAPRVPLDNKSLYLDRPLNSSQLLVLVPKTPSSQCLARIPPLQFSDNRQPNNLGQVFSVEASSSKLNSDNNNLSLCSEEASRLLLLELNLLVRQLLEPQVNNNLVLGLSNRLQVHLCSASSNLSQVVSLVLGKVA